MIQILDTNYRYMTDNDIEVTREIEAKANPVPWTEKNFTDCLSNDYYCLIQEVNKEVSGFAIQTTSLKKTHLLNIGIREKFRKKGLGQDLLNQIVSTSKEMGSKKIFLEVRISNKEAIELYNKSGFKKLSLKKNYYRLPDGREDALVMVKKLRKAWRFF